MWGSAFPAAGACSACGLPCRRWYSRSSVGWLAFLALACSGEPGRAEAAIQRDSAGIRIIDHPARSSGFPLITLAHEPDLVIGVQLGDEEFALHRVSDARFLSDGRIVVANGLELLWFEDDGRLDARNGGQGGGPSEFQSLISLAVVRGDTVLAVDRRVPAAKAFGPDGSYAGMSGLARPPVSLVRLDHGTWVGLAFLRELAPAEVGLFREDWAVLLYSAGLEVLDTLMLMPGAVLYGDRQRSVRVPASPAPFLAARGGRIVAGSSDRYEVRVFETDGKLIQVVRNAVANPAAVLAGSGEDRARPPPNEAGGAPRELDPPLPDSGPAFDALLLTNDGEIWIRRYGSPSPDREWHVYGRDGRLAARARIPDRFRPTEITRSHVLGIWRDELDVESIRTFRLVRSR